MQLSIFYEFLDGFDYRLTVVRTKVLEEILVGSGSRSGAFDPFTDEEEKDSISIKVARVYS